MAVTACGSSDSDHDSVGLSQEVEFLQESGRPDSVTGEADSSVEEVELSATPLEPTESDADETSGNYGLRIPALGVQAPIVPIPSTSDRVLVPPRDPGIVGWWRDGAAPGDAEGSAILVGHTVSTGGGVFNDIGELSTGDLIEVDELSYEVQSIDVVSKDALPRRAEEIFDQSVSGRLVVVTCADWDGEFWQSNIVTIATPV